jgi:hypothetical protein
VTAVSDGFVTVGFSDAASFGGGDWTGVTGKDGRDAIIVKYDLDRNVVWKKNFGGSGIDEFRSVTAVSDGFVAVGYSQANSFNNGDWTGVTGKGGNDAIIVKYDNSGNVMWKKNFGGESLEWFNSVTTVPDGVVAVGIALQASFGTGDWEDTEGKGGIDAIVVKYDNSGNVMWKKNFGGTGSESFLDVVAVHGAVIAVGFAHEATFGTDDWEGVGGKGSGDAIFVIFEMSAPISEKKSEDRSNAFLWAAIALIAVIFILIFLDDDDDKEKDKKS